MSLAIVPLQTPIEPAAARARTLADQLVLELAEAGITTYFGVPGGAIEPLFDALARQRAAGRVRVVPMRSEAGAAFAADGYFRATGGMAVCTATTGPGISNLLTAIMAAHADRIPMLVLTPQVALRKQGRGALQDSSMDGYDLPRMLAECTRYSTTVTHPEQLAAKLARAVTRAFTAPMGPVHLSVPSDVLAGSPSRNELAVNDRRTISRPIDLDGARALANDLAEAERAVIYVGDDAGPEAHRLCHLAKLVNAQVVSSPAGKRWVGHLDRTYRGVLGFSGHAEAKEAIEGADLVMAVGATFDELSTNAWTTIPETRVYAVDQHADHAYRLPHAQPVIGETGAILDLLLSTLPNVPPSGRRAKSRPRMDVVRSKAAGPVHPSDLMRYLGDALPPDVVVHVDAGNSFSWSTRDLVRSDPDTYRVAMGLSTMCWAIGAVIGAAVARPRRTLCIAGDGSMLMSSLELTVAVEQNLPVTYVVLNDSSLGMVRHGQRLAGAEPIAHDIAAVRFDKLAEACGATGIRVESIADLARVPKTWLEGNEGGPCVLDVRIDREAVPPMADRVLGLAVGIPK